jgi:hypothetical protein
MTILERVRIARIVGEAATNPMYWNPIATAAAIIDIDGDLGPPKSKISFLEARLEWLQDEGWEAVILDNIARIEAEEVDDADEKEKSEIKNS